MRVSVHRTYHKVTHGHQKLQVRFLCVDLLLNCSSLAGLYPRLLRVFELLPEFCELCRLPKPAEALVAMVGGAAGEANAEPNVWRAVMSWRVVLRYWE